MIRCETREAAQEQAEAQGAHLLTINDKAEQEWLLEVFGKRENFWIGLINDSEEGKQQWDNGEPVTYTNWMSPQEAVDITKSAQDSNAKPELHRPRRNDRQMAGSTPGESTYPHNGASDTGKREFHHRRACVGRRHRKALSLSTHKEIEKWIVPTLHTNSQC